VLARTIGTYAARARGAGARLFPGAWSWRLAGAGPPDAAGRKGFSTAAEAVAWVETERPNVLAVIAQVARDRDRDGSPALDESLGPLVACFGGLLWLRSHWRDVARANLAAVEAARRVGSRPAEAVALCDLGIAYHRLGRDHDARACHERGVAICRGLAGRAVEARHLTSLGTVLTALGRYDQALASHRASLALSRELDQREAQVVCLERLGELCGLLGRGDEAVAFLREGLGIARLLDDGWLRGRLLNSLGRIHQRSGRPAEAIACQEESYARCVRHGDRDGQTLALRDLGDALRAAGRGPHARLAWQDALALAEGLRLTEAGPIRARLTEPVRPVSPGGRRRC
jgi:tetratricopeptide (TPR) repeat protein